MEPTQNPSETNTEFDIDVNALGEALASVKNEKITQPATQAVVEEKSAEAPPVAVEVKPDEPKAPVYDDRVFDEAGKQVGGSVYYDWNEVAKSRKEANDALLKMKDFANRKAIEAKNAKDELDKLRQFQYTPPQYTAQPPPVAQPIVAQQATQRQEISVPIPPELSDVIGDDAAKQWANSVAKSISTSLEPIYAKLEEAEKLPQKIQEQTTQDKLKEKAQIDRQRELDQVTSVANQFPDIYTDIDTYNVAIQDQTHPDYEKALALDELYVLGKTVGFPRAHKLLMSEKQQPVDVEAITKKAAQNGHQQALQTLKTVNARPAVTGKLDGTRGFPTKQELSTMRSDELLSHKMQHLSHLDLTELNK